VPWLYKKTLAPHPLFRDFVGMAKTILREGDQQHLPLTGNIDKNAVL